MRARTHDMFLFYGVIIAPPYSQKPLDFFVLLKKKEKKNFIFIFTILSFHLFTRKLKIMVAQCGMSYYEDIWLWSAEYGPLRPL